MAYVKTNWVDDVTPLSAMNMNNIEDGLAEHKAELATEDIAGHINFNNIPRLWSKINEITLSVNTTAIDITIPSGFEEIRIIGNDLRSSNATILDLLGTINNVVGVSGKYYKGVFTYNGLLDTH